MSYRPITLDPLDAYMLAALIDISDSSPLTTLGDCWPDRHFLALRLRLEAMQRDPAIATLEAAKVEAAR